MGKPSIEVPKVPDDWNDTALQKSEVGEYYLPSLGKTYLSLSLRTRSEALFRKQGTGISLQFESAYRDQEKQDDLHRDPTAITPAKHSLHSAGRGVDVAKWRGMDAQTQAGIVGAAKAAGLSWGGDYSKPDPPHFYFDPGTDRRQLIDNFTRGIAAFQTQLSDR